MSVTEVSDKNGWEGSVEFSDEDNVVSKIKCHVVMEDNISDCEVVTRLALKHGIVLQGDENEQLNIFVDKKENDQLKSLCGIPKAKVKYAVNKVNCVLKITDI